MFSCLIDVTDTDYLYGNRHKKRQVSFKENLREIFFQRDNVQHDIL